MSETQQDCRSLSWKGKHGMSKRFFFLFLCSFFFYFLELWNIYISSLLEKSILGVQWMICASLLFNLLKLLSLYFFSQLLNLTKCIYTYESSWKLNVFFWRHFCQDEKEKNREISFAPITTCSVT